VVSGLDVADTVPRVGPPKAGLVEYAAVQVALNVPGVVGVTHATVPWSSLHVCPASAVHGPLAAPVICAGVTVPPVTVTAIEVTAVVLGIIPPVGWPSAEHVTWTVAPAATLPEEAERLAVTTAPASGDEGDAPTSTASDAHTNSPILMPGSAVQSTRLQGE
jgi:hypothetical protein